VNIKSMLMRLASALNCPGLIEQLILHPGHTSFEASSNSASQSQERDLQFVVGYNSSPHSHAALDLTLWIAYQTRLVRRCSVVVHVVYVLQPQIDLSPIEEMSRVSPLGLDLALEGNARDGAEIIPVWQTSHPACAVLPSPVWHRGSYGTLSQPVLERAEQLSHADRVLWQARCLANEWRGSLQTHLRFGDLATELAAVVETEEAALLIVGCQQSSHPLVTQLGGDFPCPVLGIPTGELDLGGSETGI
jgi:hypothetical protein